MKCRHCEAVLKTVFVDLGTAPPSNAYLNAEDLLRPEMFYPLKVMVCDVCWLVQTLDFADAQTLFTKDYAYFSSTSRSWVEHARQYCEAIIQRLRLGADSFVVEIASNDGYLLQHFRAAGVACLGIEPTDSTAAAAEALGIPVMRRFFGEELARELVQAGTVADLIVANNVYAHVPDINDFTRGLSMLLAPEGTITLEFPHLQRLIENKLFDTIYHEHYSYLSLSTVARIFASCGLRVYDVEELSTHGGSLRVYGCRVEAGLAKTDAVVRVLDAEQAAGLASIESYRRFQTGIDRIKDDLLEFLIAQKRAGKRVVGYGAAAKGNTLLNFAGVRPDLLPMVCDAAPAKQGKYLPGSRIPIVAPEMLDADPPDVVLILPWNLAVEILDLYGHLAARGTRFVTAVPALRTC